MKAFTHNAIKGLIKQEVIYLLIKAEMDQLFRSCLRVSCDFAQVKLSEDLLDLKFIIKCETRLNTKG